MAASLINGITYSWTNITVNIMGVPTLGISSIEYEKKQAVENIYAQGAMPNARGFGRIELSAKITILMDDLISLRKIAPFGFLPNIPEFDIMVSFIPVTGKLPITHKIRNCRFMNDGQTSKEGDTSLFMDIDILPADIEFN